MGGFKRNLSVIQIVPINNTIRLRLVLIEILIYIQC